MATNYRVEVTARVVKVNEDGTESNVWEDKGQIWHNLDYLGVLAIQGALLDGLEQTRELGKANAAAKGLPVEEIAKADDARRGRR